MNGVTSLTVERPRGTPAGIGVKARLNDPTRCLGRPVGGSSESGPARVRRPTGRLVAGRYRLQSLLGRGGMGRVWLAEDELLARLVAIKQEVPSGGRSVDGDPVAGARLLGEARAAARVDHDAVVRVLDVVYHDGRPWIVMEALSGCTLAERITGEGPLPVDEVVRIGLCLAEALDAIHQAGLVHRDVKPANVQLCERSRVVLTDFGIACSAQEASDAAIDGAFVGSPAYVSPEQLRGDPVTSSSDLFSLGATLFAAVEGQPPFGQGDLLTTVTALLQGTPAPSRRAGRLRPVIEGLLRTQPEQRASTDQTRAALWRLLQHG